MTVPTSHPRAAPGEAVVGDRPSDGMELVQAVAHRPADAREHEPAILEQGRGGVLRWFTHRGLIDYGDVRDRLAWQNSGSPLDASVHVASKDRAGLERLLGCCARPPFAFERLELLAAERVVYRLPKPQRDGTAALTLTPLELIEHLEALIPPPRRHCHRYHGVLAPNEPRRAAAVALGRGPTDDPSAPDEVATPSAAPARNARSPVRYLWAMLLARLFNSLLLVCPIGGADMHIEGLASRLEQTQEFSPCKPESWHVSETPGPRARSRHLGLKGRSRC